SLGVSSDQRGRPRKVGPHVDIGACEVAPGTPAYLTGTRLDTNRVFHFVFTNAPGTDWTVLTATNASLPVDAWAVLESPVEMAPGQFHFFSQPGAANAQNYYRVRSP